MLEQGDGAAQAHGRFLFLTQLMRPPVGFNRPEDVVKDPALSLEEKREILAAWASDAFAPPDHPGLRWLPGAEDPVPLMEINDALRRLDGALPLVAGQ
jgi:hypothetical protein